MVVHPELSMTVDPHHATALHKAATQGHTEVVNFLLEAGVAWQPLLEAMEK